MSGMQTLDDFEYLSVSLSNQRGFVVMVMCVSRCQSRCIACSVYMCCSIHAGVHEEEPRFWVNTDEEQLLCSFSCSCLLSTSGPLRSVLLAGLDGGLVVSGFQASVG